MKLAVTLIIVGLLFTGQATATKYITTLNGENISIGDNPLFIDNTNLRVGIGTSNPTAMLDVNGSINTTGNITATYFFGDASQLNNVPTELTIGDSITSGTTGSILFVDGSNNLAQDNSNLFYSTGSDSLGVGTSGPDRTLDVLDTSNPQLRLTQADGTIYSDFETDSSGYLIISPTGGRVGIGATPTQEFHVAGDIYLTGSITFDDTVTAIGQSTSTSGTSVTVIGASATASANQATAIGASTTATATSATAIGYGADATNTYALAIGHNAQASAANSGAISVGSATTTNAIANSILFGVDGTNALFVNQSSAGIFTTNPQATLHVNGSINVSNPTGGAEFEVTDNGGFVFKLG